MGMTHRLGSSLHGLRRVGDPCWPREEQVTLKDRLEQVDEPPAGLLRQFMAREVLNVRVLWEAYRFQVL